MEKIGEMSETSGVEEVEWRSAEWKIKEFFSLPAEIDTIYDGPVFSFAGASWHLRIYPNGRTEKITEVGQIKNSEGSIGLYLYRTSPGPSIHLEYSLGFKTLGGKVNSEIPCTHNFEETEGYGYYEFISKSELLEKKSELVPSGVLTVVCKIKYPKTADFSTASEKLSHDFKKIMLSGDHSDMVVKTKGEEFRLHRSILAACNPYFDSMFKTNMKEKSSGIVIIEDCEPDTFRSFTHFVYTGKVDRLSPENVCELYEAADKYQEDQLKDECLHFMKNTLSVDSFCDFFAFALRRDEKELFQKGIELFTTKGKEIARSVKWQVFVKEYPTQASELFIKTLDHYIKLNG